MDTDTVTVTVSVSVSVSPLGYIRLVPVPGTAPIEKDGPPREEGWDSGQWTVDSGH